MICPSCFGHRLIVDHRGPIQTVLPCHHCGGSGEEDYQDVPNPPWPWPWTEEEEALIEAGFVHAGKEILHDVGR